MAWLLVQAWLTAFFIIVAPASVIGTDGIDWSRVIFKGLFLKGIYGREIFETWYKMQAMLLSGLDISPVITHRYSFDDFEKGFAAMLSGESGKVVLSFD